MTQDNEALERIKEGMYFSDRCRFCREFGEKTEPYLCPKCVEGILKLGYHKHEGESWNNIEEELIDALSEFVGWDTSLVVREKLMPIVRKLCLPHEGEPPILSNEEQLVCSLISKYPYSYIKDVIEETCLHQIDKLKREGWL